MGYGSAGQYSDEHGREGCPALHPYRAALSPRSEYATRCSELRNAGIISVTGEQRMGESGLNRDVSRITKFGIEEWNRRA